MDVLKEARKRRLDRAKSCKGEKVIYAGYFYMLVRKVDEEESFVLISRLPKKLLVRGGIRDLLMSMKKELEEALSLIKV